MLLETNMDQQLTCEREESVKVAKKKLKAKVRAFINAMSYRLRQTICLIVI